MTRAEILDKAKETVTGRREQDYGSPEDNFSLIGKLWSAYLGVAVGLADVAHLMCLFKIARLRTGTATEDSYVDLAGYAACGGEIAAADAEKKADDLFEASRVLTKKIVEAVLNRKTEYIVEERHYPTTDGAVIIQKLADGNITVQNSADHTKYFTEGTPEECWEKINETLDSGVSGADSAEDFTAWWMMRSALNRYLYEEEEKGD